MKKKRTERRGDKRGVTFVELLVALTLLMILIMSFTPMLVYSYNTVYKAGTINEKTYQAKSAMEQGLSLRDSKNILYNLKVNFLSLGEAASINLRRIASDVSSDLKGGIESLFYQGKGSIRIVSAQTVNDDKDAKDVVIQVKGIVLGKKKDDGTYENEPVVFGDESKASRVWDAAKGDYVYVASIQVFAPVDGKSTEKDTYPTALAASMLSPAKPVISEDATGNMLVSFRIQGQDLTNSPLKIQFNYIDENGTAHTGENAVTAFLYIDPPTIMLAGKTTSSVTYYTTAGMADGNYDSDGHIHVEGRKMSDISVPNPGDTVIRSINWITNDATEGYGQYYILTGTNGTILRLYRPKTTVGLTTLQGIDDTALKATRSFTVSDSGRTKVIYPTTWGGDATHQFWFSSTDKESTYGSESNGDADRKKDNCWRTQQQQDSNTADTGLGQPGVYSTQAKFSYFWSGLQMDYINRVQKRRNISYILNEWGCALRFYGRKNSEDQFGGYQTPWNRNKKWDDKSGSWEYIFYTNNGGGNDYKDNNISTIAIKSMGTGSLQDVLYDGDFSGSYKDFRGSTQVVVEDVVYLPKLNSLFYVGSVPTDALITQLDNSHDAHWPNRSRDMDEKAQREGDFTMYCLVGSKDASGVSIYKASETNRAFETIVPANDPSFLTSGTITNTHGDTFQRTHEPDSIFSRCWCKSSPYPGMGITHTGKGDVVTLTATRFMTLSDTEKKEWQLQGTSDSLSGTAYSTAAQLAAAKPATTISSLADSNAFFVGRGCKQAFFNQTYFNMGFSSNREFVYANICYKGSGTGSVEKFKSYEPYYFKSHYGLESHDSNYTIFNFQNASELNIGSHDLWNQADNDYYNVWFPGECYNLTRTISKEGVTVAVGYAVSGSSYQYVDNYYTQNTSTALGGIFNDGVLAACIDDRDTELSNLLYFKDNATMDTTYLSSNAANATDYKKAFDKDGGTVDGTYGTHARQSVRFTAVDLLVQESGGGAAGAAAGKKYYAYYGDNTGRIFVSQVASATGTLKDTGKVDEFGKPIYEIDGTVSLSNYIADLSSSASVKSTAGGQMSEIRLGTSNAQGSFSPLLPSVSTVFDEITDIIASDDTIIISGTKNNSDAYVVVGKYNKAKTTWTFKAVKMLSSAYTINATAVVDGTFYAAGKYDSGGFLAAFPVSGFVKTVAGSVGEGEEATGTTAIIDQCTDVKYGYTATPLYAIAGRGKS